MMKEPYNFKPFDYKEQMLPSKKSFLDKKNDKQSADFSNEQIKTREERIEQALGNIVDYVSKNYVDKDGNYRCLSSFASHDKHPEIEKELKTIEDIVSPEYFSGLELGEFIDFSKFIELAVDKYDRGDEIFDKIKNIKLFNDAALSKLVDGENMGGIDSVIDKSREIANDSSEGYFVRIYAKVRYLSNLDWYSGSFHGREEEADKEHGDWVDIREMNDNKFNDYQFEFSESSFNLMLATTEWNFSKEELNAGGLKHVFKRDVGEDDWFDGDEPDFVYGGDFIACDLAPGIAGVYSLQGDLIGWSKYKGVDKGDLTSNNNSAGTLKMDIQNQDDALNKAGGGDPETLSLFKMLANLEFRTQIKKDLGIDIGEFNISTQFQLLNFIKEAEVGEVSQVREFLKQGAEETKANRVKSFLSLEQDPGMGEVILSIGEQLQDELEVEDRLFAQYAEMVDGTESIAETIMQASSNKTNIDKSKIINQVLFEAKELLDNANEVLKNKDSRESFIVDLEKVNSEIILLNQVIKQLPREDVAELNLRDIEQIDRKENLPANELLEDKETLEKMKQIIRAQFPEGDDIVFEEECENNNNLKLTITMANNEIISFFSKERVSENVDYIDWFIANPDAPVRGLGEATLRLGFNEDDKVSSYAVAKPHVKSFNIFIEKLGFVSFEGSTTDSEYKDHYARVRKLASDKNLETKKISEASLDSLVSSIKTICLEKNRIESYLYKGRKLSVCKLEFHGQIHKDDILESDDDGWIMAEIKRQYSKGNVLTRYIPENSSKDNQVFYAIFEEDNASEGDMTGVNQVIDYKTSGDKDQLDSKKALSS